MTEDPRTADNCARANRCFFLRYLLSAGDSHLRIDAHRRGSRRSRRLAPDCVLRRREQTWEIESKTETREKRARRFLLCRRRRRRRRRYRDYARRETRLFIPGGEEGGGILSEMRRTPDRSSTSSRNLLPLGALTEANPLDLLAERNELALHSRKMSAAARLPVARRSNQLSGKKRSKFEE